MAQAKLHAYRKCRLDRYLADTEYSESKSKERHRRKVINRPEYSTRRQILATIRSYRWVIHSRPIESKAMFICFAIVGSAEKQFTHSAVEKTQNQSTRSLRAFMAESNLGFGRDKGVWKGR